MTEAKRPAAKPSASSKIGFWLMVPIIGPIAAAGAGYAAWKTNWQLLLKEFFTGPGRLSRILLLLFTVLNWKNMPFAWTARIFYPIYYHHYLRRAPKLGPRALFAPVISESFVSLLETDYNIHKSNSTYFADLDVSRTHLLSYICGAGFRAVSSNLTNQIVLDPTTKQPPKGSFGIMLGSVHCSFHKEIPPYRGYEMWSRVLSFDRKWVYIVTHIVPKGLGRPTEWLDPKFKKLNRSSGKEPVKDWEKKVFATAISKYVFKLGRLTVHPAVVLGESGLLPERPGGWLVDDASPVEDLPDYDLFSSIEESEWDWQRVEQRRRAGMKYAEKFQALDQLQKMFDGGQGPIVGRFGPG
ncbi:uncharacterized protein DNG_09415 [Cephalotrichum gorgonifer]|uniref:Capsule polysaccharide biosynthesis protein n=1 Tax=Cephalotrichum gorgonifer TaxID=2041049 RepID=A0AAE8SZA4_9PEZI|nr:uncharacterized protein DNG_09415 [Cephalotrichum gorgonifer]